MSKDYVSHIFKKSEGINLMIINSEKMKRARMLLETTTIPVNLVALKVECPIMPIFLNFLRKARECEQQIRKKNN